MPLTKRSRTILSIVGGFAASFLTFLFSAYTRGLGSMRGQLVAGDATANRELPTTLNMMHGAFDASDPVIAALSSYTWWTVVLIFGCIASFVLLRVTRRYV